MVAVCRLFRALDCCEQTVALLTLFASNRYHGMISRGVFELEHQTRTGCSQDSRSCTYNTGSTVNPLSIAERVDAFWLRKHFVRASR